ncbi:MAG TPA: MarR family transcriptional regulator [Gemmatimonadaceae bacterium]|nr:MarR family transcriptional regulator [Gemmatimonadaceae bacterium]
MTRPVTRSLDPATARLVERFGLFFAQEGLPRIAGRITGYLLLSDEPRSLDDLATALGVSKASVSTDARRLEARGFLRRSSRPGDRRDFYAIAPDGFRTTLQSRIDAIHRFGALLRDAERLPGATRRARDRITEWNAFHRAMAGSMAELLEQWEARAEAPASTRRRA